MDLSLRTGAELPEDDERAWEAPEWATPINSPHNISFENWREE